MNVRRSHAGIVTADGHHVECACGDRFVVTGDTTPCPEWVAHVHSERATTTSLHTV